MSIISVAKGINSFLEPFRELALVGGKLYLGSMFYLDFGRTFMACSSSGRWIEIGEMTVSVRDVQWLLYRKADLVLASEDVTQGSFDQVLQKLIGANVWIAEQLNRELLEIRLGDSHRLMVDLTNSWESDSDVVEFALPDGRLLAVSEHGELIDDVGVDEERVKHWINPTRRQ